MPLNPFEFFYTEPYSGEPYDAAPTVFSDCRVTPLIDGVSYFTDFYQEIALLPENGNGASQILIAGWDFNDEFKPLIDKPSIGQLLLQKANAGIDVRILIWVNDFLLDTSEFELPDPIPWVPPNHYTIAQIPIQVGNLLAINNLRNLSNDSGRHPLKSRVVVNYLDHDNGAAHMKFAVIKNNNRAMGYTGGLDFEMPRAATRDHKGYPNYWHDLQVKVEGPVVQELYKVFATLWNAIAGDSDNPEFIFLNPQNEEETITVYAKDQVERPMELEETLDFDPTLLGSGDSSPAIQNVQSIVTWPESELIPNSENGIYQIRNALSHAISLAEKYIYIEDQAMASRELFGHLRAALLNEPDLKLIMLSGRADPNDPPTVYPRMSINEYLYDGLGDDVMSRIIFCSRPFETIHSKLWIIDDQWALIGSSNMLNRSLYIDIEHSLTFAEAMGTKVRSLRIDLWGEHFGIPESDRATMLRDLNKALHIWNPEWGIAGIDYKLPWIAASAAEIPTGLVDKFYAAKIKIENGKPVKETYYGAFLTSEAEAAEPQDGFYIPGEEDGYPAELMNEAIMFIRAADGVEIRSGPNENVARNIVSFNPGSRWVQLDTPFPHPNPQTTLGGEATTYVPFSNRPKLVKLPAPFPGEPQNGVGAAIEFIYSEWVWDVGDHPVNPINPSLL